MNFLPNTAAIRSAVHSLFRGKQIDMAVAFIRADWEEILADYKGQLRVICWLSSTNTDPYAVETLMRRPRTTVKQRHAMHCKVYLAPSIGSIVGSANLSKAALDDNDTAGQDEAGIYISEKPALRDIQSWFQDMWNDKGSTGPIERADISAAKAAFDKAQAARQKSGIGLKPRKQRRAIIPPLTKKLPSEIRKYVKAVKSINLRRDLDEYAKEIGSLQPEELTNAQRDELIAFIVSWTGHPGSYSAFGNAPISKVRKGLRLLFDESIELRSRLETLRETQYLPGLRIPTLSLLLYWRSPERYPPYNQRTEQFLKDLKMRARGMSASSPSTYATWLQWATRFHQKLGLPTAGHVDRLVNRYYEDQYG